MAGLKIPSDSRFCTSSHGQEIPSLEVFCQEYATQAVSIPDFVGNAPIVEATPENLDKAKQIYTKCLDGIILTGEEFASFRVYMESWNVQRVLQLVSLRSEDILALPDQTPVWYAPSWPVLPGIHPHRKGSTVKESSLGKPYHHVWFGGTGFVYRNGVRDGLSEYPHVWLAADDNIAHLVPSYLKMPDDIPQKPFRASYRKLRNDSAPFLVGATMRTL